jgi:hypothetical protein
MGIIILGTLLPTLPETNVIMRVRLYQRRLEGTRRGGDFNGHHL